jgi:hypothetical protein
MLKIECWIDEYSIIASADETNEECWASEFNIYENISHKEKAKFKLHCKCRNQKSHFF